MNEQLEKKFEKIAETAIEDAEAIDCTGFEFVEGLKVMEGMISHRLACATDELGDDR